MSDILKPYMLTESIELRNRLAMAPMTTWSAQVDGQTSLEELDYYRVRSSGVGLVITGTTYTLPNGMGFEGQFYAGHDLYTKSIGRLAQAIHSGGAKAVLQIFHAGRMSNSKLLGGNQPVSASDVPALRPNAEKPRPLTEVEIDNIITSFYETTRRAIEAGFDGVELHGANTYLLQQFFSPHSNKRTDHWGGDLEGRMAFPLAVIDAVQKAVRDYGKEDFIIGYRLSPEEIEEPGITIDDTLNYVNILCTKKLTYLNLSLSKYDQTSWRDETDQIPVGKRILDMIGDRVPILGVGGIDSVLNAEDARNLGYSMVQLGKSIIMNPDWVKRAEEGQALRETLNPKDAKKLFIPKPMLAKIQGNPGWFPIEE